MWFKISVLVLLAVALVIGASYLSKKNIIYALTSHAECRAKVAELDGKVIDILTLANACEDILIKSSIK